MTTEAQRKRAEYLIAKMNSLVGGDIIGGGRKRELAVGRAIVGHTLIEEGMTEEDAGELLGRNHSTINHYKGKIRDILTLPGYQAEWELYMNFKSEIQ